MLTLEVLSQCAFESNTEQVPYIVCAVTSSRIVKKKKNPGRKLDLIYIGDVALFKHLFVVQNNAIELI